MVAFGPMASCFLVFEYKSLHGCLFIQAIGSKKETLPYLNPYLKSSIWQTRARRTWPILRTPVGVCRKRR